MLERRHLPDFQPTQLRAPPDTELDRSRRTSRPSRFPILEKIRRPSNEESLRQPVRARRLSSRRSKRRRRRRCQGNFEDLIKLFISGFAADQSEQVDAVVFVFERILLLQQEPSGGLLGEERSSSKPGLYPKFLSLRDIASQSRTTVN